MWKAKAVKKWRLWLFLSLSVVGLLVLGGVAFADPNNAKQNVSNPAFWVSSVVAAFLVISGVEALLKSRGVLQSEADREVHDIYQKLQRVMPSGVALEDTLLGKALRRTEAVEDSLYKLEVQVSGLVRHIEDLSKMLQTQLDERLVNSLPDRQKKLMELQTEMSVQLAKASRIARLFLKENNKSMLLSLLDQDSEE